MNEALMNIQSIQANGVLPTDAAGKALLTHQLPNMAQTKTLAFSDVLNQAMQGIGANSNLHGQDFFSQQVNALNRIMQKGDALAMQVATGQADNLHEVMIQMEEVKMAFQLALQVKNRLLEAYQEMMRMQV